MLIRHYQRHSRPHHQFPALILIDTRWQHRLQQTGICRWLIFNKLWKQNRLPVAWDSVFLDGVKEQPSFSKYPTDPVNSRSRLWLPGWGYSPPSSNTPNRGRQSVLSARNNFFQPYVSPSNFSFIHTVYTLLELKLREKKSHCGSESKSGAQLTSMRTTVA